MLAMKSDAVINSINSLPKQLEQSWTDTRKINFPANYKKIANVVLCGMGGSRFPALIVSELFKTELLVPVIINDNYQLPEFVDEKSLIILSSYSGTTEEVITMGKIAQQKKANITAITSGGELSNFCQRLGVPGYFFDPIFNPSGQPRIGFGYAVGGLLGILYNLRLVKISNQSIDQALINLPQLLKKFSPVIPKKNNPAKQLADKISQKYPYYIISEFLTGVGNAIANQTNETAKSISSFRVIPELNHHLMEGLKHPEELGRIALFIFFFSNLYSSPIKKRFSITKDVVRQNKIETAWYELEGKTKVEQVFELMGLGSYLTMYLSQLYHENPTAIPFVDYFKKKLKEMK